MRTRLLLAAVIAVASAQLAANCRPASGIQIVAPGASVTTFSFGVQVEITSDYDPTSLIVRINGEPVAMSGGPTVFTATVNPGDPLLDDNEIEARARLVGSSNTAIKRRAFSYLPPKARAFQITSSGDLISGVLAHNQVGDYMLENSVAKFAIQDANQRDLHSVGQFGGQILDAELLGRTGLESFFELAPSLDIETVINATSIEIVNDGQNGLAAEIRACGPDDLLDIFNASSQAEEVGGMFPPGSDDVDHDITGCNLYTLEPFKSYVRIDTTVSNNETSNLPIFVGDYVNGAGEFETLTSEPLVTAGATGVGEILVNGGFGFFNYYGIGEARGVDYTFISGGPDPLGCSGRDSSSFTTVGVSFVLHGDSIPLVLFGLIGPGCFTVPAKVGATPGTKTYTRHFGVGDGDGTSGLEMQIDTQSLTAGTLSGCVTVAGTSGATPVPHATIVAGTPSTGPIEVVRAVWTADASGCYSGDLPVGSYAVAAARRGWNYEGGGTSPTTHAVTITANTTTPQDIELPNTGQLTVNVDEATCTDPMDPGSCTTSAVPARVSVVGFDPSPEQELTANIASFVFTSGLFSDPVKDPIPYGIVHSAYANANGTVTFDLEPNGSSPFDSYQVFVTRGTEYSSFDQNVTISAGSTTTVNVTIAQVLDTPGFVSSDFHVHQINSPDSRINHTKRAAQYAGEGVDNLVITDHDAHADISADISSLSLTPFLQSTIGEEITTFDYGHFNSYPRDIDPTRIQSGGSTDWGGAAPAGQDFPSFGNYVLTPEEIHTEAVTDPVNTATTVAVQINHIGSHFNPLKIDSSMTPPSSNLTNDEALGFRLPDNGAGSSSPSDNFFFAYPALELWNGYSRSHALTEFLDERLGIWVNLLNQGLGGDAGGIGPTAIADTDSHEFHNLRSGGARSWTASPTDTVSLIDGEDAAESVIAGRAVGGQGSYVQARLLQTQGSEVADLTWTGSKRLDVNNSLQAGGNGRELDLEIAVQAPLWAEYDTIEIYANSSTASTGSNDGVTTLFTACPDHTMTLGGGDFTRSTVQVAPASVAPDASRFETSITLRIPDDTPGISLSWDTWFAVVVKGTDNVSEPMFPQMPASLTEAGNTTLANLLDGNLNEGGVLALGHTNALYASINDDNDFDPPGVSEVGSCP